MGLSAPRKYIAAVGTRNKAFFAGGQSPSGASNVVDVWDNVDRDWDRLKLSQPRMWLAGATLRNIVAFGGGMISRNRHGALGRCVYVCGRVYGGSQRSMQGEA